MGGGGAFYDRDTTDGYERNDKGYSARAEQLEKRKTVDQGVLFTRKRRLRCNALSPIVLAFDVTGSMGTLPKILSDKLPMLAGQLAIREYLRQPMISLAAIGDIRSDTAPIQVTDFVEPRHLDSQLERLFFEGFGGGNDQESYEFTAYAYAERSELPEAQTPFFIFTGDEGFRPTLAASDLERHFDEKHARAIDAKEVFDKLKQVYHGNVIKIRRSYGSAHTDGRIQRQWEEALGADYIVPITDDQAIGDITLGVLAVRGGATDLDGYLCDMETARDKPQSKARIKLVEKALTRLAKLGPTKPRVRVDPDFDPEDRL